MRVVDLILKTRAGVPLSTDEISLLVSGATDGGIPDYQLAAWLMAVCWRGLTPHETADLTMAMARSGDTLDLAGLGIDAADKHSTGGIGDKTTLVVAPLVAATGLTVAKMSGRALGFTGGTLDKLEAIPGMRVDLSPDEFVRGARERGLVIAGQSSRLAPADGRLYALRDVTGTVESIPLIASSVMSKKLAAGASTIVLDVKAGSGAFMGTVEAATELAEVMVDIGRRAGRRMAALVTDMGQPLGRAIGNTLEVREAIATLRGEGPADLTALCRRLAAEIVLTAGREAALEAATSKVDLVWREGRGLAMLRRMVAGQGGDPTFVDEPSRLPSAPCVGPAPSPGSGIVQAVDGAGVGALVARLGAGRQRKGEPIDHAVGIEFRVRIGDRVERGDELATIHARTTGDLALAAAEMPGLIRLGKQEAVVQPLIHTKIG